MAPWLARIVDTVTRRNRAPSVAMPDEAAVAVIDEAPPPRRDLEAEMLLRAAEERDAALDRAITAEMRAAELEQERDRAIALADKAIAAAEAAGFERDQALARAGGAERELDAQRQRSAEEIAAARAETQKAVERAEAAERQASQVQQDGGALKRAYDVLMGVIARDAGHKAAGRLGNRGRAGLR